MPESAIVAGVALGLGIAAFGIGIVVLLRLLNQPPIYQQQQQYQPQREEVLIRMNGEGRLSDITPLSIRQRQKKRVIGYVTSEE